jgi:CBS domain-containing protein
MRVKDIMTSNVVAISPEISVQTAAKLMKIHDIGMLPVKDDDQVLGIITDRDIAVRAVARGWNPALTPAREIMSEELIWCFDDLAAEEAAHLMAEKEVRRLLVFNREMILTGVVSLEDIAVALRDEQAVGRMLRDVSCPVVASRAAA